MPKIDLMKSLMTFGALAVGPPNVEMNGALLAGHPIGKG